MKAFNFYSPLRYNVFWISKRTTCHMLGAILVFYSICKLQFNTQAKLIKITKKSYTQYQIVIYAPVEIIHTFKRTCIFLSKKMVHTESLTRIYWHCTTYLSSMGKWFLENFSTSFQLVLLTFFNTVRGPKFESPNATYLF